jgi:FKBP-type peptidyl-prolyl cis-trans isomerase FkpA
MPLRMILSRPLHRLAFASLLPLLATSFSAEAQTRRKAAPPRPVAADTRIIPLPLNPIVPAGQRLCAARTASGLGYTMLRPGAGAKPGAGDLTLVNYVGYLAATGAVFDQGMRSALSVGGVIPGFGEGLQLLAKGGVVRLCIPAALGYGAQGTGPIPANAALVFQVELIDYRPAAAASEAETPPSGAATPQ